MCDTQQKRISIMSEMKELYVARIEDLEQELEKRKRQLQRSGAMLLASQDNTRKLGQELRQANQNADQLLKQVKKKCSFFPCSWTQRRLTCILLVCVPTRKERIGKNVRKACGFDQSCACSARFSKLGAVRCIYVNNSEKRPSSADAQLDLKKSSNHSNHNGHHIQWKLSAFTGGIGTCEKRNSAKISSCDHSFSRLHKLRVSIYSPHGVSGIFFKTVLKISSNFFPKKDNDSHPINVISIREMKISMPGISKPK